MQPTNPLELVRRLASNVDEVVIFKAVLEELRDLGLDSDDLLDIIQSDLAERDCFKSKMTEKYHPGTTSDYYSIWVSECSCYMFLKILVDCNEEGRKFLVISSFKKDDRHV